jgi:hypothetical protein
MIKFAVLLTTGLFVLGTLQSRTAFADCAVLGKQANENDTLLSVAMDDYKSIESRISKSTNKSAEFPKAIAANTKLIKALDNSIESLERGESDGCFGKQAATWKQILEDLKIKRNEFNKERQVLLKAASVPTVKAPIAKADWKSFLTPSIEIFSACVVLTKRRALALDGKRPSPQDFAIIMRGACNSEAFSIDAVQNKIENWTPENRQEIKEAIDSIRTRAMSEYSESFYGMR